MTREQKQLRERLLSVTCSEHGFGRNSHGARELRSHIENVALTVEACRYRFEKSTRGAESFPGAGPSQEVQV